MTAARIADRGLVASFAYLSIAVRCINRGNLIIDEATRQVLSLDPARTVEFDAHSPLSGDDVDRINACAALVLPGATLLQPEDHPSVAALGRIRCPILAVGVALRSILDVPDVTVARQIGVPVGSRDPFTHRSLRRAGIRSRLVGCQTLFFGRAQRWRRQDGPIVVTLGLGEQGPLERCAVACADLGPTVVLAQAPGWQRETFDHRNMTVEAITTAGQTLALLDTAAVVVTGRLHMLLASVALGVPAIFMGGWYDSRYSLIEYLGVPVEPPVPRRIRSLTGRVLDGSMPRSRCLEVAENLRQAMRRYLSQVAVPLGLGTSIREPEKSR